MDKKALAKSTGHLARCLYGRIDPVRVIDTKNLWRSTGGMKRILTLAHGASRAHALTSGEVGYPILSIYGSRTLSPAAFAEAKKFLAETTLTMADLIDADGHDIDGILPDCITLRIVNNRDLVGEYTTVKAEQDAEDERIVTEHRARIAASEMRNTAQQDETNRKLAARKAQADKLTDQLGELGVNNMILMQSEHSVIVDVRTLEGLIALAQKAKLSTPACISCGTAKEVMFGKDSSGALVAYCFDCRPEDTCEVCFSAAEPCDCDWHKSTTVPDLDTRDIGVCSSCMVRGPINYHVPDNSNDMVDLCDRCYTATLARRQS